MLSCASIPDLENLGAMPAPPQVKQRLKEVMQKWNWQQISKTCFCTPIGTIDLFADGDMTIKAAMKAGWEHQLWNCEPRAADLRGQVEKLVT